MNTFLGADTVQLRSVAGRFAVHAQQLRERGEHTLRLAQSVTWVGRDAEAFLAECAAIVGDLFSLAGRVEDRARAMEREAEQQERASGASDAGGSGGPGAWGPPLSPPISPWPLGGSEDGSSSWTDRVGRSLDELADKVRGDVLDDVMERAEETLGSKGYWANIVRKGVPVLPDAIDAFEHAAAGETKQFGMSMGRMIYDFHPIAGPLETASAIAFPLAPDHWKFPGTDRSINEGSLWDHGERFMVEQDDPDDRLNRALRGGESVGSEISDRLGIENEKVRNVVSSVTGAAAWAGEGVGRDENGDPYFYDIDPSVLDRLH
jgi:hypothetical protein